MKFVKDIHSFFELLFEAEDAKKDIDKLKKAVLEIEDVEFEEFPDDRKMIIKTDNVDLATRLHKFILNNQREYIIKGVKTKDINDLEVVFKSPEEVKQEEEETEQKIKDAEAEKDAMMGIGDIGMDTKETDIK